MHLLRQFVLLKNNDILIFTETWLNNCFNTAELGLENYDVFRFDGNVNSRDSSRGGGVLVSAVSSLRAP